MLRFSHGVLFMFMLVVVALCCVRVCFCQSDAEIEASCQSQAAAEVDAATSVLTLKPPKHAVEQAIRDIMPGCRDKAKIERGERRAADLQRQADQANAAAKAAAEQIAENQRDDEKAAEKRAWSDEKHTAMQQLVNWWTAIATTLVLTTSVAVHRAPQPYRRTILIASVALGLISCLAAWSKLGVSMVFVFDSGFDYVVNRVLRPMGVRIEKHGTLNVAVNAAGIAGDVTIDTTIKVITAINLAFKSLFGFSMC